MLLVRCAACKAKLFKYRKIGPGHVVRCHKDRITRVFELIERDGKAFCPCGKPIGIDKDGHFRMIKNAFTASGEKLPKR